jgi:predicted nucleic acid-binding protein
MTAFVDTSVWFAAVNANDRSNSRAKSVLESAGELVTSDFVLFESWLLLRNKLSWTAAETFSQHIRSGVSTLEYVLPADIEMAHAIGIRFADQEFSLTDRTSFALMERLGIDQVASFDIDFAVYRFGRERVKAFQVLR